MKKVLFYFFLIPGVFFAGCKQEQKPDKNQEVLDIIAKVNNNWQTNHPEPKTAFWHEAAYHTGNMEAYKITGDTTYLNFSKKWAEHNKWQGATEPDTLKWVYSYGETPEYVLFGDWQICFQTYADLYNLEPDSTKIARAREVMEYEMSTPNNDYWWWADGLYMVMPVMTKLGNITGNPLYYQKLHDYFSYAKDIMYDPEAKLFYRDTRYVYPEHQTLSGKKDFWARGNGWVVAGLAKILSDLPENDPYRNEYADMFKSMMSSIKDAQQEEGYWSRSLLDEAQAPGPETSGTAFFEYAMLWGVNNGYLDEAEYKPSIDKAWEYLTQVALQEDGTVGYVQPIGDRAVPDQVIDANSTADFGVGAFLLAASEMSRYLKDHPSDE